MIGVSLPYKKLLKLANKIESNEILTRLWNENVRSIEIRAVVPNENTADVLQICNFLWDNGFSVTIHALCKNYQTPIEDIIHPLELVLKNLRQSNLIITIHPINGDNIRMLTNLSDHIYNNHYPIKIALENNRKMPDNSVGDSMAFVTDIVTTVNRKNVGICFDMGHYAWFTANHTNTPNLVPPKEFLSKVIHTHIHSYMEGSTHFPLFEYLEPISLYIKALEYNYFGVYNIELDAKRYADKWDENESYLISSRTLKDNYSFYASYYDDTRLNYDKSFLNAIDIFNKNDGCYTTLVCPSSYLFSTYGYHWAMDVSFLYVRKLAKTPSQVRKYLKNLKLILITHAHADHMEEETIRSLSDTDITWITPSFLKDKMLSFGIKEDKLITVNVDDELSVGPLNIRVLEGRHFRPNGDGGIETVGFLIKNKNGPSIAFPSDVRDYTPYANELNADYCFAHLWLTDMALDPNKYVPKSYEFANFSLSNSRKNIFITHLYTNRPLDKVWTNMHAEVAQTSILEKSPETNVRIPKFGEIFKL